MTEKLIKVGKPQGKPKQPSYRAIQRAHRSKRYQDGIEEWAYEQMLKADQKKKGK